MRILSYIAAMAILVASGVAQGLWSGRREMSHALEDRVARLGSRADGSSVIGRANPPRSTPRMIKVAELDGYLLRRYVSRQGDAVTVLLVCGRPGPISVHTPETCYGGVGYKPVSSETPRIPIDGGETGHRDEFWMLDMMKPGASAEDHLRIFYAWTTDGDWEAADNPRYDFAASTALCKMYIVRNTTGAGERIETDPSHPVRRRVPPGAAAIPLRRPSAGGAGGPSTEPGAGSLTKHAARFESP